MSLGTLLNKSILSRGETPGGYGGPPQSSKKQIFTGKVSLPIYIGHYITFIATCCPNFVFEFMVFHPILFSISVQLGKPNRNEASNSNIYTFLFFVH